MYRLKNSFRERGFYVTVVGCGGTGGYVAESMCRLLPVNADLILIDHDRVEERNLARQNFTRDELGELKSEALAKRLSQKFGRGVGYATLPVSMMEFRAPGLVIGCVDNGPARKQIENKALTSFDSNPYSYPSWWIDAGNGDNYGQILIGNGRKPEFDDKDAELCWQLPVPTIQRPDLLNQVPQQRGCAEIDEQNPTINLVMAALVVDVTRRTIDGTCPWMQLYLDLETGMLTPIMIPRNKGERR